MHHLHFEMHVNEHPIEILRLCNIHMDKIWKLKLSFRAADATGCWINIVHGEQGEWRLGWERGRACNTQFCYDLQEEQEQ